MKMSGAGSGEMQLLRELGEGIVVVSIARVAVAKTTNWVA